MTLPPPFDAIERLVAVVGCQRSGTTLIGQLLGANNNAILLDEFDGLYQWYDAILDEADDSQIRSEKLLAKAALKYRSDDNRFFREGCNLFLTPQVKVLVFKAPNLTFDDDKILRSSLPVTIAYPIRDPRAVVASMSTLKDIDFVGNQLRRITKQPKVMFSHRAEIEVLKNENEPLWIRQAMLWRLKSGRSSFLERLGLSVYPFRYEDVVRSPQDVLGPVMRECSLDVDGVLFAHSVYVGYGPGGTDRTRRIDTSSTARWRETLTLRQQMDVMRTAAPLAGQMGYV